MYNRRCNDGQRVHRRRAARRVVSLDVKEAFEAAWWSSILMELKDFNCPRNLYCLTKNYFSHRTAVMSTSSVQVDREVNKGCTQEISNTTHFLTWTSGNKPKQ
jgi:hypothetical protein